MLIQSQVIRFLEISDLFKQLIGGINLIWFKTMKLTRGKDTLKLNSIMSILKLQDT